MTAGDRQARPGGIGVPAGPVLGWWRGDPPPRLPALGGLSVARAADRAMLSALAGLPPGEVGARLASGHTPYAAFLTGEPVAYGWSASVEAEIGGFLRFRLPPGERYLWDFATLPHARGRGVYPRLIRAIVRGEGEAERFWIAHEAGNTASAKGIARAGFRPAGELRFLSPGLALLPTGPEDRARAAARLLGVPLLDGGDGG